MIFSDKFRINMSTDYATHYPSALHFTKSFKFIIQILTIINKKDMF